MAFLLSRLLCSLVHRLTLSSRPDCAAKAHGWVTSIIGRSWSLLRSAPTPRQLSWPFAFSLITGSMANKLDYPKIQSSRPAIYESWTSPTIVLVFGANVRARRSVRILTVEGTTLERCISTLPSSFQNLRMFVSSFDTPKRKPNWKRVSRRFRVSSSTDHVEQVDELTLVSIRSICTEHGLLHGCVRSFDNCRISVYARPLQTTSKGGLLHLRASILDFR